ncbi:hypothetical protein BDV93DRAFT_514732 [Ceratobasidium sp. AG-I]|nr:hypothetical protein BDV93DRAFT_514732 [Ceratobasidium sp. AG-I]
MSNSSNAHQLLFLAVESTFNHSSQTQVDVLKNTIIHVCNTAACAPKIGENSGKNLQASDVAHKFYGASGDHANDQLKGAALEKEWKLNSWFEYLGNESLLQFSGADNLTFLDSVRSSAGNFAGGMDMFSALEPNIQATILAQQQTKLICALGEKAYAMLAPEEKKDIGYFVRFGCCMHKDMNAVKGAVSGFQKFWNNSTGNSRPILLPNRDNDAVITLALSDGSLMSAEQRAISTSDSGAIKLCSLSGMLFNNKDDKKGLQDEHTFYFESKYDNHQKFPDTSNVQYGSFVDAATELFVYHNQYLSFMDYCRNKNGLSDLPTLAELTVLSLYGQTISRPYVHQICIATLKGKSMAELSELHKGVIAQLQNLLNHPELLFQGSVPALTDLSVEGTWSQPAVFTQASKLWATLPYLPSLLSEFFQSALTTWEQFTQDILPACIPLSLTPEETMKCFTPPTNDASEGVLGTWREKFTPEMYSWLRQEVRRIDSSKKEELQKFQLVEATAQQKMWWEIICNYIGGSGNGVITPNDPGVMVLQSEQEAAENIASAVLRLQNQAKKQVYLSSIILELDISKVDSMNGDLVTEQLKAHRELGEDSTHNFSGLHKLCVAHRRDLLKKVIKKYLQHHSHTGSV